MNKEEKINELLTRGVEEIFVREHLEKELKSGKKLRIKFGIDPTGPAIHLGRAIPLRKLKAFQDLGHKIVLIVGDFTAQIGDPSDKLEKRPMLTRERIKENLKNYKKIIGKIIDVEKAEFVFNSKWLSKLGFQEISELAESFSVGQMSNRRNFKDRLDRGEEVSLREFLYPLMQGYDSVAIKADVEIGGFDQLFNLKAGRVVQKHFNMPEQDIVITEMLEGTDGRKMSTSWGNVITTTDEPNDMFGKVMSLKDELIIKYFTLCTDAPLLEISGFEKDLKNGMNPRDVKVKLAFEIVTLYHGVKLAEKAKMTFIETFSKGAVPEDVIEIKALKNSSLMDLLVKNKIVASNGEFRRLVKEGAITDAESGEKITDTNFEIKKSATYRIGKKRFVRITS